MAESRPMISPLALKACMISLTMTPGATRCRNAKKNKKAGMLHMSQRSRGGRSSTRRLDALEYRAVLDEDAAALVGAPHALDVVMVLGETLAVLLVGGEAPAGDEGQGGVGGAGEPGGQPVPDELAPAARDDAAQSPRVPLEVVSLPRVDRVANAQCDHGVCSSHRMLKTFLSCARPAGVTTTARVPRTRRTQPRSRARLASALPTPPATWGRRSLPPRPRAPPR